MSCTLDNKSRIIPGNTTVPVPEGSHSIAVYVKDTTGNVGTQALSYSM